MKVTVAVTIIYNWYLMWVSQVLAQLDCTEAASNAVTNSTGCIFSSDVVLFCSNFVLATPVVNDACVIPDLIMQLHNNT